MKRIFTPLGLGIAVPFLTLIVLALSIYVPGFFVKPTNDFIYTLHSYANSPSGSYYAANGEITYTDYGQSYQQTDTLVPAPAKPIVSTETVRPKLYRYHMNTDVTEEISLEAANALDLSTSVKSPEGFTFNYGYGSRGGILGIGFGSYDSGNIVAAIEGKGIRRELKIDSEMHSSLTHLAWIK